MVERRRDDQRNNGHHQQRAVHLAALICKILLVVFDASVEHGQPQNQQQVAKDGTDQRSLRNGNHGLNEVGVLRGGVQGHPSDDHFNGVAERCVEEPPDRFTCPKGDFLCRLSHQERQRRNGNH